MKIKLTLNDVYLAVTSLKKLANQDVPIGTAFRLRRMIKELDPHLEVINETRLSLIARMADGGDKVPDDKLEAFHKEMQVLFESEEVEVKVGKLFTIQEMENAQLSSNDVSRIYFLFETGQDE